MYKFHKDKKGYFNFIHKTSKGYIIPFIEDHQPILSSSTILEIGCAEGGVLKAFTERGMKCLGIELSTKRVETARILMKSEIEEGLVDFISKDIYDINPDKDLEFKFDVILLKDVIEHIFHQEKFMEHVKGFLKPNGRIFFGFPPWQMPFGGHQQVLHHKLLSKLPYFHLLPKPIYKTILKLAGESPNKIKEMMELKETGLSIERFEKIVRNAGFNIAHSTHYLINPVYKFKFGLNSRKQLGLIRTVPFIRNFFTTGVYYLIQKDEG